MKYQPFDSGTLFNLGRWVERREERSSRKAKDRVS